MIHTRIRPLMPFVMAALVLTGCGGGGLPAHFLKLTPESLQNRALQTREYEGVSEADLLSASTGVIQDLGFIIEESETSLGLIVGSKDRDAPPDAAQRVKLVLGTTAVVLVTIIGAIGALASGAELPSGEMPTPAVDDNQRIWVSLVIRPASEDNNRTHLVRVTFQRIVWNNKGEMDRRESLDEPEMYQGFFDLLSNSVFLEGEKK